MFISRDQSADNTIVFQDDDVIHEIIHNVTDTKPTVTVTQPDRRKSPIGSVHTTGSDLRRPTTQLRSRMLAYHVTRDPRPTDRSVSRSTINDTLDSRLGMSYSSGSVASRRSGGVQGDVDRDYVMVVDHVPSAVAVSHMETLF